tara:strand:+ start:57 stop:338 length:282 start_codon:yes stop_codon:yes gene_type:complete
MAEGIIVEEPDHIEIFNDVVRTVTSSGHNDLYAGDLTIRFGNGSSYTLSEKDMKDNRDALIDLAGKEVEVAIENGELTSISLDGESIYNGVSL